jgi:hypothetical protein
VDWAEWTAIAAEIVARWPEATFPKVTVTVYGHDLKDLEAAHVRASVVAHDRAGERFPPTAGQIRQMVIELARDDPEWADVFRELRRLNAAGWGGPYHQLSERRWASKLEALPDAVWDFARACGPTQVYAAFNEEGGGEARLRDKWAAFVRREKRDAGLVGIEAPGLTAIDRANGDLRQIGRAALRLIGQSEEDVA